MAPGTRRANRSGYAEHDDFEGLPVRQWRHEWVNVAPPPQQEQPHQNDIWAIELLHGMPKDSNLLPPHSQELLLAARSGRLYKRPAAAEEEEADAEAILAEKVEKKDEENAAKGFSIKLWKQIPRNVEGASVSHLAKRQKNTVTIASRTVEDKVQGPTVTRATVRRVDAAGNPYTEEVTLTDGQKINGEIISTRVEALPAPTKKTVAPAPTIPRKRPPPPKRKSKAGPGRGRKKTKGLASSDAARGSTSATPGTAPAESVKREETSEAGIKKEIEESNNQDSEMADDDDDDEGDDGEEGGDREEAPDTPAETGQRPEATDDATTNDATTTDATTTDATTTDANNAQDVEMTDVVLEVIDESEKIVEGQPEATKEPTAIRPEEEDNNPKLGQNSHPPALLLPPRHIPGSSPRLEGSPLKNVIVPSPTTEVPPALPQAPAEEPVPDSAEVVSAEMESMVVEPPTTVVGEAPESAVDKDVSMLESAQEDLLPPPPEQVGNIATPGSEEHSTNLPGNGDSPAGEVKPDEEAVPEKPPLVHKGTEDTIQPNDSVSAISPVLPSPAVPEVAIPEVATPEVASPKVAAPEVEMVTPEIATPEIVAPETAPVKMTTPEVAASEVAAPDPATPAVVAPEAAPTLPAEEAKEEAAPAEPKPEEAKPPSPQKEVAPKEAEEPDLLLGLMNELNRQSTEIRDSLTPSSAPEPIAEEPTKPSESTKKTEEEPTKVEAPVPEAPAPEAPAPEAPSPEQPAPTELPADPPIERPTEQLPEQPPESAVPTEKKKEAQIEDKEEEKEDDKPADS